MALRLNGQTSGYVELDAPAVAGSNTLTLPNGNGTSGQYLQTDGSGGLSWAGVTTGKILQVVSTAKTDTFSESLAANTNSSTNCIQVQITPSSTSSKVLIMVTLHGSSTYWGGVSQGAYQGRLVKNGSNLVVGDTAGGRNRMTMRAGDGDGNSVEEGMAFTYLDSPSSTSLLTYGVRLDNVDNGAQTLYLNRSPDDGDTVVNITRTVSTITAMEVAG